jgi:hypothetical protein
VTFDRVTCWVPSCDSCGPDWWNSDIVLTGPPHFHSKPSGQRELVDTYGWQITRRIDGTKQMLCAACADKADCDELGHDWRPADLDHGAEQQARWDVEHAVPVVLCARCGRVRRDFPPPPGHPETMTAEVSDADEEFLAALDAELFPEEAL